MTTRTKPISPCPPGFSDYVFKQVAGVDVPLRLWPASTTSEHPAPWLLWLHGGGLIAGKHVIPNAWVIPACQKYGFHCVSVGYRLIPHVSLDDCLEDCQDALTWCRKHLSRLVGPHMIDIDRYAVGGDSAGGALAVQAGYRFMPTPKAVIDVFGITDYLFEHPTESIKGITEKPSTKSKHRPYLKQWNSNIEDDFAAFIQERDPSKARTLCPWDWELPPRMDEATLRIFWGMPEYTITDQDYFRMDCLKYLLKKGEVRSCGHHRERFKTDSDYCEYLKSISAYHMAQEVNGYPPTFFLHGVLDRAVPVEQSYRFAEKLRELGVPVGEAYHPNGDHCFENEIEGPEDEGWNEYIIPCMEFVKENV